jgi:hypothetical protein
MADHLRYAGLPHDTQRDALAAIIRASPLLIEVLEGLRADGLPDHLLVAGAIYNLVWNRLTGRPDLTGINDIDVFYHDASDLSWDAEDAVIRRLAARFAHLPLPVQVRNQARVHLWFPQKFGMPFEPLASSAQMLGRYASKAHAVGGAARARRHADHRRAVRPRRQFRVSHRAQSGAGQQKGARGKGRARPIGVAGDHRRAVARRCAVRRAAALSSGNART